MPTTEFPRSAGDLGCFEKMDTLTERAVDANVGEEEPAAGRRCLAIVAHVVRPLRVVEDRSRLVGHRSTDLEAATTQLPQRPTTARVGR